MSFGYGLHFRDELDEPVSRELDALLARLKAFFGVSFNEDGTLKASALTAASNNQQSAAEEDHWWRHGAWSFDDPRQASTAYVIGLRPPKTPTGTYHNYAPSGIDDSVIIEVEPDGGDVTLTGLRHETGRKRLILLRNRDSGNNLTLSDNNTGSFDRYQFDLPNNENLVMGPGNTCWLYYDPGRDGGRWTAAVTKHTSGGLASTPSAILTSVTDFSEAQMISMSNTTPRAVTPVPTSPTGILMPISFVVETEKTGARAASGGNVWELIYNAVGFLGFSLLGTANTDLTTATDRANIVSGDNSGTRLFNTYATRDPRGKALACAAQSVLASFSGTGIASVRVTVAYYEVATIGNV